MTRKRHHGSSLDSFLAEEGILEETRFSAQLRVLVLGILVLG
jgi:hypothetical protein